MKHRFLEVTGIDGVVYLINPDKICYVSEFHTGGAEFAIVEEEFRIQVKNPFLDIRNDLMINGNFIVLTLNNEMALFNVDHIVDVREDTGTGRSRSLVLMDDFEGESVKVKESLKEIKDLLDYIHEEE